MASPIYDKLNDYRNKGIYPFHMPGHKRNMEFERPFAVDITEIDGFDNLHRPEGIILEAERLAADTFGACESFFLVNGSSCGLIAAILSCVKEGEGIIVGRNCHKSVFDGIILSGADVHYVMPENAYGFPVMGAITAESIKAAAEKYPESRAVIVTSPTFEGIVSDIEAIAKAVHEKGMILIVDEAHGPHFKFSGVFPKTALEMGADIVVQSLHKTLPSPTQTAALHTGKGFKDTARLKKALAITQSTSPSYYFMAAMDRCREYVDNAAEDFRRYSENLSALRESLGKLNNFRIMDKSVVGKNGAFQYDTGKIVLFCEYCDMREAARVLREKYRIEVEMACPTHIIAMTSVCDSMEGFNRLRDAFFDMDVNFNFKEPDRAADFVFPSPTVSVMPRKAFNSETRKIKMSDSLGEICGEFITAYPPGIPLAVPGEKITPEILECIKLFKICNINVTGINDYTLENIFVLS